jgi:hypothetical protein
MACHGAPRGKPDPVFSQVSLEEWKTGQVIGAVVARVAPDPQESTQTALKMPTRVPPSRLRTIVRSTVH